MSILLVLLVCVILFLLFTSLVLFVIGPVMLLHPYRRTAAYYREHGAPLHPTELGLPCEELTLRTAEGIPLSCWLIRSSTPSRGTILYLHGVGESKIAALPMARLLHEHGFHALLYDARRHGDSGGAFCTYGFYEKHDASMIITALCTRSDLAGGAIGLFGVSMGAAVALQAAALDSRIRAVVAESSFATLRSVFDEYQRRKVKLPWHYLRNIVIKRSELMAHFRANAVSPLEAVRSVTVPLFLVHGEADSSVPPSNARQIYAAANPPKELWLIPGARHDDMWDVGGEEYRRRIIEFFERYLPHQGSQ